MSEMFALYWNKPTKKYVLHRTSCGQYKKRVGKAPRFSGDTSWDITPNGWWSEDFLEKDLDHWLQLMRSKFPSYQEKSCSFCLTIKELSKYPKK
jgi:hypothetical protein